MKFFNRLFYHLLFLSQYYSPPPPLLSLPPHLSFLPFPLSPSLSPLYPPPTSLSPYHHSNALRKPYDFKPLAKMLHDFDEQRLPEEIPRKFVNVLNRDINALGEGVQGRVCQVSDGGYVDMSGGRIGAES